MNWAIPERLILLVLVPGLFIAGWWWWLRATRALSMWAGREQWRRLGIDAARRRLLVRLCLTGLAAAGLVLSLARPRWGETEQQVERMGIDTVVVLDSSASMNVADVTPSRLDVAKALLAKLTRELDGHRFAILQMEGTVRALTPMTADLEAARLAVETVRVASLERPGTDIGLALERAARLFLPGEERHRGILLITDGEDHGSNYEAARRNLIEQGIAVHVLAVGSATGGPVPIPGAGAGAYKQDNRGQVVVSKLEGELLQELAQSTAGVFVVVERAGQSIEPIVSAIRGLEARSFGKETILQQKERFQLPLVLSLLALAAAAFVHPLRSVEERP